MAEDVSGKRKQGKDRCNDGCGRGRKRIRMERVMCKAFPSLHNKRRVKKSSAREGKLTLKKPRVQRDKHATLTGVSNSWPDSHRVAALQTPTGSLLYSSVVHAAHSRSLEVVPVDRGEGERCGRTEKKIPVMEKGRRREIRCEESERKMINS